MYPIFKISNTHQNSILISLDWKPSPRDLILVFCRGGKILTDFLEGQNMKKKIWCAKTQKSLFFKFRGRSRCPPPAPSNDVPA